MRDYTAVSPVSHNYPYAGARADYDPLNDSRLESGVRRGVALEKEIIGRLAEQGLRRVPVDRDGNCLFHSLSYFVPDDTVDHRAVRQLIVSYIAKHRELFRFEIEHSGEFASVDDYCVRMGGLGEWGDAIALQAFILIADINVRLFTEHGFSDLNPDGKQNVALLQFAEHYEPAVPIY